MRTYLVITILAALLPTLLYLTCITPPEPRPDRLSSPIFTNYEIVAGLYGDEYHEVIHLQWIPDSTDTISIIKYQILRKVDIDSSSTTITDIPSDVNDLNDPTVKFIDDPAKRTNDRLIFYRIFAIDSLERPGDTSVVCTVSLARLIDLLLPPIDTIPSQSVNFRWLVPQIFNSRVRTHIVLWKNDSTIWQSAPKEFFTGGGPTQENENLPPSLLPLIPGEYFWGAYLIIIGGSVTGDNPTSINIRNFYVK